MRRGALVIAVVGLGSGLDMPPPATAQDASFGCKVLLCAAAPAPAPGWAGIPYCVPVMQTLFRQLAKGGGWPSCAEGNTSGHGYEPYQACPSELTPVQLAADGGAGLERASNGGLCADLSRPQQVCSGGDGGCTASYPTTPREARSDPYFVDITTANRSQRFYFSLQGY